jgi:hypothetical protein
MSLRTVNGKVIEYKLSESPKCLQHRGLTLTIVAGNFRHSRAQ